MTTVTLRPTGINGGAGDDYEILQTAINAASDGDVLLLKARKLADEPAGPITPWFADKSLAEAKALGPAAHAPLLTTPSGSFDWLADNEAIGLTNSAWGIDSKQLTLKGDVDGSNNPITLVKGAVDQAAHMTNLVNYYAAFDLSFKRGSAIFTGGNKLVRFENLLFKYNMTEGIFAVSPYEIVNCRWDFCSCGIHGFVDNRHLGNSLVADCQVSNCDWRPYVLLGNDITIRNSKVTGLTTAGNVWNPIIATGNLFLPDLSIAYSADTTGWGSIFDLLDIKEHKRALMTGCDFDFTGSAVQPATGVSISDNYGVPGGTSDIVIENNTFTKIEAWAYSVIIGAYNDTQACSVTANTFTECSGALGIVSFLGWDYGYEALDCLSSDNTFVDCVAGPAEYFLFTNSCQSIKNDYIGSELPTNAVDIFASCIVLDSSSNCTVFETGRFPAGQGGPIKHVSDLNGYNNRIVGTSANKVEKPAGIGQLKKGLMRKARRNKEAKVTARHDRDKK